MVLARPPTATVPPTPATASLPAPIPPPTATTTTTPGIRGEPPAPAPPAQGGLAGSAADFCFLAFGRVPRGLVVAVMASVTTRGEPSRGETRLARCSMRTRRSGG